MFRVSLGLVVLALATVPSVAQTVSGVAPPAEVLVARAIDRAPSIRAVQARNQAASESVMAADALPDPTVDFEYRAGGFPRYTIGTDPGSMVGATIRQNLLSRPRRTSRRIRAQASVTMGRSERAVVAAELAAAVQERYARLYVLDQETDTLHDADEVLQLLEATVLARYGSGDTDQAAVVRIQLEHTRLRERLVDVAAERQVTVAELNGLTNDPPDQALGRVEALTCPPEWIDETHDGDRWLSLAPRLVFRSAAEAEAVARVDAAHADLGLGWSVGGGLYWQGGLDRMAVVSVGIELPFWKTRKQLPLLRAAQSELDATRAEQAAEHTRLVTEVSRLGIEARTADQQAIRYRDAILPQSSAALNAVRSSFLAGRGDFVSLVEEFRRWIEVRVGLSRREADGYTARARRHFLMSAPAVLQQMSR